jgi:UDP-N-acetylglucosamine 1-carboxyvinyltransferase
LHGADVIAKDLRGGAGLVVAGLRADGISRVGGVEYIDRGYENIEYLFSSLGAKIQRKKL